MLWARARLFERAQIGREVFTRFRSWERGELEVEHERRWTLQWYDFRDSVARLAAKSELMLRRIGGESSVKGKLS